MRKTRFNKKSGFTMNELMIAATVVGLVAAITVPVILTDTSKKRNQASSQKMNMTITNALKTMRIEDTLTGNDTTENFVGQLKNYLSINKVCSKDELSGCFTEEFKLSGEDAKLEDFTDAKSFGKNWDTNINGVVLKDGTHMLLAYNPNCSKHALNDCLTAFYDINGAGKSEYNSVNGATDMGVFNAAPGEKVTSSCGENVIMIDLTQWHSLFKFKLDGPAGTTSECLAQNMDKLQSACESMVNDDGYKGLFTAASSGGYTNYGIGIGEPYCQFACIALGSPITLADGSHKAIEDISYDDDLLVWDFDNGRMSSAKPAWIKQAEVADSYNLLTFSDGTQLKTINQHRIFNKDLGKFTYPMTDETPLGTTTLLADGREVQLVDKKVVYEPVEFYNLITANHFNCFASNVLTSNRFNNLYPIVDFKFVKDNRELTPYSEYENFVSREWYEKLRLAEQTCDEDMKLYLSNLVRLNKRQLALV